jgi:hypothetical protein
LGLLEPGVEKGPLPGLRVLQLPDLEARLGLGPEDRFGLADAAAPRVEDLDSVPEAAARAYSASDGFLAEKLI